MKALNVKAVIAVAAIGLLAGCAGVMGTVSGARDFTIEQGSEGLVSGIQVQCSRGLEWRQKVALSTHRELESRGATAGVPIFDCDGDGAPDFTVEEARAAHPDF